MIQIKSGLLSSVFDLLCQKFLLQLKLHHLLHSFNKLIFYLSLMLVLFKLILLFLDLDECIELFFEELFLRNIITRKQLISKWHGPQGLLPIEAQRLFSVARQFDWFPYAYRRYIFRRSLVRNHHIFVRQNPILWSDVVLVSQLLLIEGLLLWKDVPLFLWP